MCTTILQSPALGEKGDPYIRVEDRIRRDELNCTVKYVPGSSSGRMEGMEGMEGRMEKSRRMAENIQSTKKSKVQHHAVQREVSWWCKLE